MADNNNNYRGRGNYRGSRGRGQWRNNDGYNKSQPNQYSDEVERGSLPENIVSQLAEYQVLLAEKKEKEKDKRLVVKLSFAITPTMEKTLANIYPNHRFECDRANAPRSDHPFVAIERTVTEMSVMHRFNNKKVLDIFGNPGRHARSKNDHVHACIPEAEPCDDVAKFWASNVKDAKFCQDNPETCVCINWDVFTCLYRAQSWSMDRVLGLVHKAAAGTGIIALRHFKEVFGSMCQGEITYQRDDMQVIMTVKGNPIGYRFDDESKWFLTNYYEKDGLAMAWDVIDMYGDTSVLLVTKSKPGRDISLVVPAPTLLTQCLSRDNVYGPLTYDLRAQYNKDPALRTAIELLELPTATAFSLYNWVIFSYSSLKSKKIYVPKGAVAEVRNFVALRDRDETLFASAVEIAKKAVKRYNIPPDMMTDSISASAILGFFSGVEQESSLLHPHLHSKIEPIKNLSKLLKFSPDTLWPFQQFIKGTLAGAGMFFTIWLLRFAYLKWYANSSKQQALVAYSWKTGAEVQKASLDTVITYLLELIMEKLPWIKTSMARIKDTGTRVLLRFASYSTRASMNAAWIHPIIRRTDVCMEAYPLETMHRTAVVHEPDQIYCVPKHGTTQVGFAVQDRIPVVARSCTHNELVAVVSRGCLERPDPAPGAWEQMAPVLDKILPVIEYPGRVEDGQIRSPKFAVWVKRFPPKRRGELILAKIGLRNGVEEIPTVKGFVKREKQLKSYPESVDTEIPGIEKFAPRLISGRTPQFQAVTGPVTYAMTKQMAWVWNHAATIGVDQDHDDKRPKTTGIYTSGMNAEQLGKSVQFHYERLSRMGPVAATEEDQRRFDAHCGDEAVELIQRPYQRHRARPQQIRALAKLAKTRGVTMHGIHYRVDATVKSGDGNTSSGDTCVVLTAKELQRILAEIKEDTIITWNTGDDVLTLNLLVDHEHYYHIVVQNWIDLGFDAKIHCYTSLFDAEYCSGRFWPTQDGLVFGPKPGRILAKTFHSMLEYNDRMCMRWLRTVALGLHRDTNFLPVVRVVVRRTLELTKELKTIYVKEEEKIHAMQFHEPSVETFLMYEHLYGLSQGEVMVLEKFIEDKMVAVPCTFHHNYLTRIVDVDCPEGDPDRRTELRYVQKAAILNVSDLQIGFGLTLMMMHPYLACPTLVLTPSLLVTDLILPIWEELIKSRHWVYEFALPLAEFAVKVYLKDADKECPHPRGSPQRFTLHLPALVVHTICGLMGKSNKAVFVRIAFHVYCNSLLTAARWMAGDPALHYLPAKAAISFRRLFPAMDVIDAFLLGWVLADLNVVSYAWSLATRVLNKLMHMLNGNMNYNHKGKLYELCQKWGVRVPTYSTESMMSGTTLLHTATCVIQSLKDLKRATASASSKSQAEQEASEKMYNHMIKNEADFRPSSTKAKPDDDIVSELHKAFSYEFKYDILLIDADNVKAPHTTGMPLHFSKMTYFVGVATSVPPWEDYLENWEYYFGDIRERIVEATPDAADNVLLRVIRENPTAAMAMLTKDGKLIKLAKETSPTIAIAPNFDALPRMSLMRANNVFSKDTLEVIARLFHKFGGQESAQPPPPVKQAFKTF